MGADRHLGIFKNTKAPFRELQVFGGQGQNQTTDMRIFSEQIS